MARAPQNDGPYDESAFSCDRWRGVLVPKAFTRGSGNGGVPHTLDDLAALSGVSRATVSRVINGGPVAEVTRRRVLEVLERTGFRPNAAARTLASGRSGVVGVVMHVDPHLMFQDQYFSQLLQGIADHLAGQGAGLMLWLGYRTKEEILDHVLGMSFLDGVIVSAHTLEDPVVDGLLASTLPTVLIGHRRADLTASYVDIDNEQAADVMTTHLISLGRTRIGHITGTRGTVHAEDRLTGYQRAMRRAGLDPDGLIVEGNFNVQSGFAAAAQLLDRTVDAIFCANDASAAGALEAIPRAACASRTTWRSPGSTTSSWRPVSIRPSRPYGKEYVSKGSKLLGCSCNSCRIQADHHAACSFRRSLSFGNLASEACLADERALIEPAKQVSQPPPTRGRQEGGTG